MPSSAAITARAEVRNTGEKSPTATRVAGREPLKMTTPRKPLPQPFAIRSIFASLFERLVVVDRVWREQWQDRGKPDTGQLPVWFS